LLEGLAASIGLSTAMWSETTRRVLAALFPLGELLVAAALLWPRSRRIGLLLAIVMHIALLLTLGPLGHDQKPAVLLWNVFFIGLVFLLFGRSARGVNPAGVGHHPVQSIAVGLTTFMVLLPCLSWWGY